MTYPWLKRLALLFSFLVGIMWFQPWTRNLPLLLAGIAWALAITLSLVWSLLFVAVVFHWYQHLTSKREDHRT